MRKFACFAVSVLNVGCSPILISHPRLVDCLHENTWKKDDVVITQGDEGNEFFIIESGEFKCFVNGNEVASLTAGAYFGEIALLTKKRRQGI